MKPREPIVLPVAGVALVVAALTLAFWIRRDAKLSLVPRQHIALIARKPHYESWTVEWSHGWMTARTDGTGGKTLWHWPTFRHLDMSQYLLVTNPAAPAIPLP